MLFPRPLRRGITPCQRASNDHHQYAIRDKWTKVTDGIYRINTPDTIEGSGRFSFNNISLPTMSPTLSHWAAQDAPVGA